MPPSALPAIALEARMCMKTQWVMEKCEIHSKLQVIENQVFN
jgi:hypothetical protein